MPRHSARGFTLLELMVTVAITAVVMTFAVQSFVIMDRGRRPRQLLAKIQTEGRHGVGKLEDEIRNAAAGVGTGVVWSVKAGAVVGRPAVQIFDDLAGAGVIAAKPGTDALLVVRPVTRTVGAGGVLDPVPVTVGQMAAPTGVLTLTVGGLPGTGPLYAGCNALVGEGDDAVWMPVTTVNTTAGTVLSGLTIPVLPGTKATKLGAGTAVRLATARLYYVNTSDELVRVDLAAPRPPVDATEIVDGVVLATGVENLQLDCTVDASAGGPSCPAPLSGATELASEAAVSFGGGAGPRLDVTSVGALRTVTASVVLRSPQITEPVLADAPIAIEGSTLGVGADYTEFPAVTPDTLFMRRSYRLGGAVRNVSLGVY